LDIFKILYTFYVDNRLAGCFTGNILKKTLSILLLFSWALFHYSRIVDYLQCPLALQSVSNGSSTVTAPCDCERQPVTTPSDNTGSSSTERSFSKPRPEEVFTGGSFPAPEGYYSVVRLTGPGLLFSSTPAGFTAAIFQPPRG
jgi:hypothetical protein